MCNTEKLGGAGDEANTSLLDMFKVRPFTDTSIYTFVFIIGRCCPTRAIFFLEPVSTLTFTNVGSKGNICLLRLRRILILTS